MAVIFLKSNIFYLQAYQIVINKIKKIMIIHWLKLKNKSIENIIQAQVKK